MVELPGGPILVLAGAGSGKTRVLTHRIAYLASQGVHPDRVLAVTFTNKAAGEMKERISGMVPGFRGSFWVTTFHSACLRILRIEAKSLKIDPDFAIYDSSDQLSVMKRVIKELNINDRVLSPQTALYFIERAKNRLVTPRGFKEVAKDHVSENVARAYSLYQKRLKESSAMDFADLIMNCVVLFGEEPGILEKYQDKFLHVLVDEYQDTNTAQYELIKRLVLKSGNICVVGDDDQSIYRWRGADLNNILDFEEDFPNTTVIKLEKNYRSTKNILNAAGSVVKNNIGRKDKNLFTDNKAGERVTTFYGKTEYEETEFVGGKIKELITADGFDPSDFAIFYRTNAQSRVFEDEFIKEGLPYQVVGGMRFYERREIKDALAYMRVARSHLDSTSLMRILNVPPRGIGVRSIEKIANIAREREICLFDALKAVIEESLVSPSANRGISSFIEIINGISSAEGIGEKAIKAVNDSGLIDYYQSSGTMEAEGRIENLKEFVTAVTEYTRKAPDANLSDFLDQIALVSDVDRMDDVRTRVSLLTLHSAKGLEFPVVFMVGMEEGLFPHSRSMDYDDDIEEERRLCYVGMTRAKELLYMTSARKRQVFGQEKYNSQSRFIKEIDPKYIEDVSIVSEGVSYIGDDDYQIDRDYDQSQPDFSDQFDDATSSHAEGGRLRPGARIRHPDFGIGVVKDIQEVDDRFKLTVLFSGIGVKKIVTGYVPIELLS